MDNFIRGDFLDDSIREDFLNDSIPEVDTSVIILESIFLKSVSLPALLGGVFHSVVEPEWCRGIVDRLRPPPSGVRADVDCNNEFGIARTFLVIAPLC